MDDSCPILTSAAPVSCHCIFFACRDSQVVRWFWELLHGFSLEQKRAFLQVTRGGGLAGKSHAATKCMCFVFGRPHELLADMPPRLPRSSRLDPTALPSGGWASCRS